MAYFSVEVNPSLARPPCNFSASLAKLRLTSLVKSATCWLFHSRVTPETFRIIFVADAWLWILSLRLFRHYLFCICITIELARCYIRVRSLTHLPLDKMAAILAVDISKYIFLNQSIISLIQFPLKFVPMGPIDNKSALVQVMAWCRTGN